MPFYIYRQKKADTSMSAFCFSFRLYRLGQEKCRAAQNKKNQNTKYRRLKTYQQANGADDGEANQLAWVCRFTLVINIRKFTFVRLCECVGFIEKVTFFALVSLYDLLGLCQLMRTYI